MHLPLSRRSTFHKSRKQALKHLNWPHPLVPKSSPRHPQKLSLAGFHSTPTLDQPDLTTCYICQIQLADWTTDQDVNQRHVELSPECAWAILIQQNWDQWREPILWDWGINDVNHPRGIKLQQARLGTFNVGWPHHNVEGIPTPLQWAKAGWYFKPGNEEDEKDNCVCPYCERAVAMLEPGDDPLALHCRKAGVHCPFFLAPGEEQEGHEKVEIPDKVTSLAVGNGGKTGNGRSKKIRVEPVLVGEEQQIERSPGSFLVTPVEPESELLPPVPIKKISKARQAKKVITQAPLELLESPTCFEELGLETIKDLTIPTTSSTTSTRSSTVPTTITTTTTKSKSAKGKKSKKDSSISIIPPLTVVAATTTAAAAVVVEQKGESMTISLDPEPEKKEDLPPVVTLIKKSKAKNSDTSSSSIISRAKSSRGNGVVESLAIEEEMSVLRAEEKKVGRTAGKGMQLDGEEEEAAERSMVTASQEGEGTTNIDFGPKVLPAPVVVLPPPSLAPTTTSSTATVKKSKKKTVPGGGNTKRPKSIIPLPDPDSISLPVPLPPFPLYNPSPLPTLQIPKITPQEESLTVEEWYLLCGERMAKTFELEAEREFVVLRGKYELAREMILSQGV